MVAQGKVHLVVGGNVIPARKGCWRDVAACHRVTSADPYGVDALVTMEEHRVTCARCRKLFTTAKQEG